MTWPDGARNAGEAALYSAKSEKAVVGAKLLFPQFLWSEAGRRGDAPQGWHAARCGGCHERRIFRGVCVRCQVARNRTGDPYRSEKSALPCSPVGWTLWLRARAAAHVWRVRLALARRLDPFGHRD